MLKIRLLPLGLSLKKKKLHTGSSKNIFSHLLFIIFSLQRLICWSIKTRIGSESKPKRKEKDLKSDPRRSGNIRVWLPHESCQTAQTQRSAFRSQPSRSLGNSPGRPSRWPCRSACQRQSDPGEERKASLGDIWEWLWSLLLSNTWSTDLVEQRSLSLKPHHRKPVPPLEQKSEIQERFSQRKFLSTYVKKFPRHWNFSVFPWIPPKCCKTHRNVKVFITSS